MELTEKLIKPVIETKYLTVENADRYRVIVRHFYLQYERLKYWLYQEEVYDELMNMEYFQNKNYTEEQCQQDLTQLVEWKNLLTVQDTKKVNSLEAFKNKKFRYQMSEYSVEIERMVIKLENLFIEGASLEPTLLERIRKEIARIPEMEQLSAEKVYGWWNDLNNDFVRLNRNYQDYMRDLNSLKAEEMMKTKEFLLFKDKIIEYLRTFVKSLQYHVGPIEESLVRATDRQKREIFEKVVEHEMSIPRMEVEIKEEIFLEKAVGRWQSICQWFVSDEGKEAESLKVFDTTNEIIRKITRFATQISGLYNAGANRKEEYYKILSLFHRMKDVKMCHQLAACVFGIEKPFHIKGDFVRATESINSGVFEEEPCVIPVTPRIRNYREKANRSSVIDRTKEKEETRRNMLLKVEREKKLLHSYIKGQVLDFEQLPVIEPEVRDTFLIWLSKALENKKLTAKTEDGLRYSVTTPEDGRRCQVKCTDGIFEMPAYRIVFFKGEEN